MKKIFNSFLRSAAVILFISSCTSAAKDAPVDIAKLKPEIQAMEDAFAAGEKAHDANAVAAYYSDDAISYSRDKSPAMGKAAIRDSIASGFKRDTSGNHSVYKIVDLYAEGDMAVEIGSWTDVNSAGVENQKGHYMSLFQKKDGKYLCVRDMNVQSAPPKK